MNILLLASHAVAEYDDIRMFTDLGHDVFCPGGYQNPRESGEGIRPAIPAAPVFPELIEACETRRREGGDPGPYIDWAKANLHPAVIDWADVIIAHHFVDRWIADQWKRIRHKRVIWRTCGQSNPELEQTMAPLRDDGLQIVRYSPKERGYFGSIGRFAGEDALIRFGKYPTDYGPWSGQWPGVINFTQHLYQRGEATNFRFWADSTAGLALPRDEAPPPFRLALGPGSEVIGGTGAQTYDEMLAWLARARVYLYTGTRPASYTLGLMEAMLSGIPVVSIGPAAWHPYAGDLFEGHEIAGVAANEPGKAYRLLRDALDDPVAASEWSNTVRARAVELFDVATVGQQWQDFLS